MSKVNCPSPQCQRQTCEASLPRVQRVRFRQQSPSADRSTSPHCPQCMVAAGGAGTCSSVHTTLPRSPGHRPEPESSASTARTFECLSRDIPRCRLEVADGWTWVSEKSRVDEAKISGGRLAQFALGLVPMFLFAALRAAIGHPDVVGTLSDFIFANLRLCHIEAVSLRFATGHGDSFFLRSRSLFGGASGCFGGWGSFCFRKCFHGTESFIMEAVDEASNQEAPCLGGQANPYSGGLGAQ